MTEDELIRLVKLARHHFAQFYSTLELIQMHLEAAKSAKAGE